MVEGVDLTMATEVAVVEAEAVTMEVAMDVVVKALQGEVAFAGFPPF